jgi:acetolactate synthase-1/2/3 large subunit
MVARGMGVDGEVVTSLEVLKSRVAEVLAGSTPAVIDVPIDRDVNAWTFDGFLPYEPSEE